MSRVPPIVRALLLLALLYLLFEHGIASLTGALTGTPAPLPSSLVLLYTGMAAIGILLYLSVREDRWQEVKAPVIDFLTDRGPPSRPRRALRGLLFALIPLLAGSWGFAGAAAHPEPPVDPPGIHFSLPEKYVAVANPLPWTEENIRAGGVLYTRNCAMCHGDAQDGNGLYARAWQPRPANFRDSGTIAQLDENYLFWRIKEGGPGVPRGSIEYRSAMPVWEGVLTEEEIWKIIMFEYTNAGQKPARRK